jgi:hypothetical protein
VVIFEVSGKLAKSVKYGVYAFTENQFSQKPSTLGHMLLNKSDINVTIAVIFS